MAQVFSQVKHYMHIFGGHRGLYHPAIQAFTIAYAVKLSRPLAFKVVQN